MPIKKDIIYPMFLECCQFAQDEYWKGIFEDLAYGITPSGTYISKGSLCCSYKKKSFNYVLEKKEPHILYEEVYKHLSGKMGIVSQKERLEKISTISAITQQLRESRQESWNKIKKKNDREALIQMYVIRKKDEHRLNIKQARYLLDIISIAMVYKAITVKEIDYRNGKVENITGIDFIKKKVVLENDIYNIEVSFSPQIVIDQKIISESWEKYVESLQKILSKK